MEEDDIIPESHDLTSDLVRACIDFVKFKDDIDSANRTSYIHSRLIRKLRWLSGLYEPSRSNSYRTASAVMPSRFVTNSLPFICELNDIEQKYERCMIRPQLVVSGMYNTYNTDCYGGYVDIHPDDTMKWSDETVTKNKDVLIRNHPRYYSPDILPLYIAMEGKNRVTLFKQYRSAMYAWVMRTETPPLTELKLINLKPFNVWGIFYSGELRILPFSEYALPIYHALGVERGEPRWDLFALYKMRTSRIAALNFQMRR